MACTHGPYSATLQQHRHMARGWWYGGRCSTPQPPCGGSGAQTAAPRAGVPPDAWRAWGGSLTRERRDGLGVSFPAPTASTRIPYPRGDHTMHDASWHAPALVLLLAGALVHGPAWASHLIVIAND